MRAKDKEEIKGLVREVIQEELKAALVRTITVEKGPRKQGDPEKRIETEDVSVLDFSAAYFPRIEAAIRGMQADLDRAKNNISRNNSLLEAIGQTLLGMEESAKLLAQFSDTVRGLKEGQGARIIKLAEWAQSESESG